MATILIIDDDEAVRSLMRALLESADHKIIEATTGIEGEKMLRTASPDIIFTDIFMPDQDGLQTIKNIRKTNKVTPIVAMSSGGPERTSDYLRYAKILGATHIVPKSASIDKIFEVIGLLEHKNFPKSTHPFVAPRLPAVCWHREQSV